MCLQQNEIHVYLFFTRIPQLSFALYHHGTKKSNLPQQVSESPWHVLKKWTNPKLHDISLLVKSLREAGLTHGSPWSRLSPISNNWSHQDFCFVLTLSCQVSRFPSSHKILSLALLHFIISFNNFIKNNVILIFEKRITVLKLPTVTSL